MKKSVTRLAETFVEFQVHRDTLLGTFALGVVRVPLNFERDSVASLYHRPRANLRLRVPHATVLFVFRSKVRKWCICCRYHRLT